jgi:hypothetical protein
VVEESIQEMKPEAEDLRERAHFVGHLLCEFQHYFDADEQEIGLVSWPNEAGEVTTLFDPPRIWNAGYIERLRLTRLKPEAPEWTYSKYRASLYHYGRIFAIVTPDGRNALSDTDAKFLLDALNSAERSGYTEDPRVTFAKQ